MKIAYITAAADISKSTSAMCVHVIEMADALARLGHQVNLYALQAGKGVLRNPAYDLRTVRPGHFERGRLMSRFLGEVLADPPDVIYARLGHAVALPLLLSRVRGVPYVAEINGIRRLESPRWFTRYTDVLEEWAYRHMLCGLPVTPELRDYVHRTFRVPYDKLAVIPNGANPRVYRPLARSDALIDAGGRPTIGFLGFFNPQQGVDLLIHAMDEVRREIPEVLLLLGGGGPLQGEIEALVLAKGLAPNVRIVGPVDYLQSPRFLAGCDVVVAPKRDYEVTQLTGLSPLKLYMYLACRRLTVVSDAPYLAWLRSSGACLFYRANDAGDLARVLIEAVEMPEEERAEMGRQGREFVLQNHTWEILAGRVMQALAGQGLSG